MFCGSGIGGVVFRYSPKRDGFVVVGTKAEARAVVVVVDWVGREDVWTVIGH